MSVFLDIPASDWVASNSLAFAIRDRYPVSPGHTLVITRRVVADWFSASHEERAALFELVETVKRQLDKPETVEMKTRKTRLPPRKKCSSMPIRVGQG